MKRPRGEEGVDQVKVGKCVEVLLTAKGMTNRPDALKAFIVGRMHQYPNLDPLTVCRDYRDHVAGKAEPVRVHSKYLAGFFEREEEKRRKEPMNPHGPEGERLRDKPRRADVYATEFEAPFAVVDQLIAEGKGDWEIRAILKGWADGAR